VQKEVELDLLVAGDAGIRGSPLSIFTTEIIYYITLELRLKVEHVERDTEKVTYLTGIIDIPNRAAGRTGRGEAMALLTP
jgi:hypothetical protein